MIFKEKIDVKTSLYTVNNNSNMNVVPRSTMNTNGETEN